MDFKLGELEQLFYEIEDCLEYIERSDYENRRTSLYLSNGEKLYFKIIKEVIPHLLGIDTDYLKTLNISKSTNSYEQLKELISNPFKIHSLKESGKISYNILFSPYILNKIKAFKENIKINVFDTEFVCKYDSKKSYMNGGVNQKYDYIIVKKYQNTNQYGVLCLVKNIGQYNNEYYTAMSNQLFDDYESLAKNLSELINNQEITILNGVILGNVVDQYTNKKFLSMDNVLSKLKTLYTYKENFNCNIDVSSHLEYSITESIKHMGNHFDDNDIINKIITCINEGKIIEIDIPRNVYLYNIINAFNDLLCSNKIKKDETEVSSKYSELKKELIELRNEVAKLKQVNIKLEKENKQLEDENKVLTETNKNYENKNQKILELIQSNPVK